MEDPVSEEEKSRWFRQLLKVQEAEGRRYNESLVGKIVRVLVDSPSKSGEGYCLGRTEGNTIVEVAGQMLSSAPLWMSKFIRRLIGRFPESWFCRRPARQKRQIVKNYSKNTVKYHRRKREWILLH